MKYIETKDGFVCPNCYHPAPERRCDCRASDCSASDMPLDAALEFAESGRSTGGIMTHEALKTLAATIRKQNASVEAHKQ